MELVSTHDLDSGVVNLCVVYLVKPHNHLICNSKIAYKVKYISQINGGLIMFFWKFEKKIF